MKSIAMWEAAEQFPEEAAQFSTCDAINTTGFPLYPGRTGQVGVSALARLFCWLADLVVIIMFLSLTYLAPLWIEINHKYTDFPA